MNVCLDCGRTHRTIPDGVACDIATHGTDDTRRRLTAMGLTADQIDDLIDHADTATQDRS